MLSAIPRENLVALNSHSQKGEHPLPKQLIPAREQRWTRQKNPKLSAKWQNSKGLSSKWSETEPSSRAELNWN